MIFLGIDTSGKSGGVTLAEGGRGSFRVLESSAIAGGTFSAQLVPTLAGLLRRHGFTRADIGGLAAVSGPGSFTGLRVGLSAVKGLAEALQRPIATVSLLEALATLSGEPGTIATALDAGRMEVFYGLYDFSGERAVKIKEQLLSQPELVHELKNIFPARLMTSDPSVAEATAAAGVKIQQVERPGSGTAARLGLQKLLAGDTVSVEALDANYVRRSDAEMLFKGRP